MDSDDRLPIAYLFAAFCAGATPVVRLRSTTLRALSASGEALGCFTLRS